MDREPLGRESRPHQPQEAARNEGARKLKCERLVGDQQMSPRRVAPTGARGEAVVRCNFGEGQRVSAVASPDNNLGRTFH